MMKHLFFIAFSFCAIHFSFAQTTDSIPTIDTFPTIDSPFSYSSIHYRGSVTISMGEQTHSGQINLVNVIDSFLYIQLNAIIEVGRVLLTPDRFLLINKLEKNYFEGDYSFFQYLIDADIDFYTIQAIFNNFPFDIPDGITLSYEEEQGSFFKRLLFEITDYELKLHLEVKKVTFNDVPKVSATVPKNFTVIKFWEED